MPAPDAAPRAPSLKALGNGIFELGGVRLDKAKKTLTFPATVNMTEGLVEYLLVHKGGKLHESVLRTDVPPLHLHLARLLISPTNNASAAPSPETLSKAPAAAKGKRNRSTEPATPAAADTEKPAGLISDPGSAEISGDSVGIWITWQTEAGERRVRAEDLVLNLKTASPMTHGDWTYNGSRIVNRTLSAQHTRSIVAIITDPDALINNPRPGRESDEIWQPHGVNLPPLNTPVEVRIEFKK